MAKKKVNNMRAKRGKNGLGQNKTFRNIRKSVNKGESPEKVIARHQRKT